MTTLPQRINLKFRSKEEVNGLPLVHINIGTDPETGKARVAKGIVAIGNIAYGVVSIGGVAFGVVTLAGIGLGVVSLGGIALGVIALGAIAMGYDIALGAVVQSAEAAVGLIHLDSPLTGWFLMFAAFIALITWGFGKVKDRRQQS